VSGFKVHVYHFLEVSIFPGAVYTLLLQLTRDITELFHSYFLNSDPHPSQSGEGREEAEEEETKTGEYFYMMSDARYQQRRCSG